METKKPDFTDKYEDDFIIRFTYHSNAIEGNTLTINETISIVQHQTSPHGKSLREVQEAITHAEALESMIQKINNEEPQTHKVILDIHFELMDRLDVNRGRFKNQENMILGSNFDTAFVQETPFLIEACVASLNDEIQSKNKLIDVSQIIAQKHIEFERIHPFNDGNGRTGRLLMNYSLLENGYPPFIIEKENRLEYMESLNDLSGEILSKMILKTCIKEQSRAKKFGVNFKID